MSLRGIIFDLDGVLIDSRPPIASALRNGLVENGLSSPPVEDLESLIGPPLPTTFRDLIVEQNLSASESEVEDLVTSCMAVYRREYAKTSLTETLVYDGALDTLSRFHGDTVIGVATSKPIDFTTRLLEHLGLADLINAVTAPLIGNEDEPKGKTVERCLHEMSVQGGRSVFLIGDRANDIKAAHQNDLFAVGATWGIGDENELRGASADAIVHSFEQLTRLLVEGTS
jgi:phosphoglycolate phosphatase